MSKEAVATIVATSVLGFLGLGVMAGQGFQWTWPAITFFALAAVMLIVGVLRYRAAGRPREGDISQTVALLNALRSEGQDLLDLFHRKKMSREMDFKGLAKAWDKKVRLELERTVPHYVGRFTQGNMVDEKKALNEVFGGVIMRDYVKWANHLEKRLGNLQSIIEQVAAQAR